MAHSPDFLLFSLAALGLVLSPGPNMMYLISRSISQGRLAGIISLSGVISGFLFHIVLVSFGLTAVLFTVPFAYNLLKLCGTAYLVYLAFQTVRPGSKGVFEISNTIQADNPTRLFSMGFLTNVLNPKVAFFYLSFFSQFIRPDSDSVMLQSFQLGIIQMLISFIINFIIIISASKMAGWFNTKPVWIRVQKWFMAGILTSLAVKMAFDKGE